MPITGNSSDRYILRMLHSVANVLPEAEIADIWNIWHVNNSQVTFCHKLRNHNQFSPIEKISQQIVLHAPVITSKQNPVLEFS
jgi:hypothetical protein